MRRLAQKLEEEGADSELRRYCERILRVRSSGWTQGIFANFAAESMVPKGPEWGGGNWEIKTPINLKGIPQWELAGEVMPYMKTDDGPIPSIVTDHIGVYLGSIKGRGNVVEVRDNSLVKVLSPSNYDGKVNGLQKALVKSTSDKSKGAESLMGLETLSKQFAGPAASDEQAKAEEEFKKSLYGNAGDSSSSDEEGVSKSRKIHIRIRDKPVTSTTVDVNKIKEATKQLKLGEGLGMPMSRTKSLSNGSDDLGQILAQPTPSNAAFSAPADPFGTDSLIQPTAPMAEGLGVTAGPMVAGGAGVTARPIPEDFFQNTIPSLQVAASLPPPGTYLSKMDQSSQGVEVNRVATTVNQFNASDIGLPDGGVPPQAPQQPVIPVESFGLPDGGVPPQSVGPGAPQAQTQAQAAQAQILTQPLDLSVLGVTDSAPEKPPARPTSPPTSVRPGQVFFLLISLNVFYAFFSYFFICLCFSPLPNPLFFCGPY